MTRRPHIRVLVFAAAAASLVAPLAAGAAAAAERLVNDRCPVTIDEFTSPLYELQYRGASVRFCCAECRETFREDPAPYLAHLPQLPPTPAAVEAGIAPSSGDDARADRAAAWLDRWMVPALVAAAALSGAWLVARVRRGARGRPPSPGTPERYAQHAPAPVAATTASPRATGASARRPSA